MGHTVIKYKLFPFLVSAFILFLLASCRSIKPIEDTKYENFKATDIEAQEVINQIPGSEATSLKAVKGKGKALVSTPDRSDRVTLSFAGNRDTTRLSIHNRIGINGGELMASSDSILIYDKIEQKAHKISIAQAHSTQLNSLASTNLVEVLNYRVKADKVKKVLANQQYYLLILVDNTEIRVSRDHNNITRVKLPAEAKKPYNSIQYESYKMVDTYSLPQKITITSADRSSRVTLLVQSLSVNPSTLELTIDLPDKITVQRP